MKERTLRVLNIAKLITPEVIHSIFQDIELKLEHYEFNDGNSNRRHTVQAILKYKGKRLLESNEIDVVVPSP
jgi:hypothetical protein